MHVELAPPGEEGRSRSRRTAGDAKPTTSTRLTGMDELSGPELAMVDAAIAARGRAAHRDSRRSGRLCRPAGAAGAVDPDQTRNLGQDLAQRALPVRLGKKYKHCHGKHE